ncbi:MAG: serine/threonine-protein kinase [Gemmatimonadota bacterium]
MSEPPTSLRNTLADRYAIERELGRGGMATVYLAQDLKHHRPVALKVLHAQLAAVLGTDRFLREIETAANLNHPHILPLFDSGEAAGLLWYAMPLVEGESLRDRLDRERQLPLDDALQITREVTDALGFAHSRGIIHRDIKPENILLAHGHALVADFGIARAVGAAAGTKITETGLAIGTPAYMSPEQALGQEVDGRSDIYALGCVLYEMLAGEPPYTGPTAQAILARRLIEPVPSLRTIRDNLPASVEAAIHTALARTPADRFATAGQFAAALVADGKTEGRKSGRTRPAASRWWLISAAILATVAVAVGVLRSRRASSTILDPNLIAVFPFRMSGTDTSYPLLRDGMVDFFETKFSGEGGPRVLPTRTALAAWHRGMGSDGEDPTDEAAARLARGLGAGSLVLGTLVATPGHLLISGTLLDAATGRIRAQAKVEGAPDRIQSLVDSLAARLVAFNAGVKPTSLASLTTTSLPALYAYLAGRVKYRAGQYAAALIDFDRAIELDSTFALGALGSVQAATWADPLSGLTRLALAWTLRDRLSSRDRLILAALAGPGYPGESSPRDAISALEAAVRRVPDDPDLWTYLGDRYFHDGALVGLAEPFQQAADAFNRALSLDTTLNVEPMIHLLQIAEVEGDTGTVRRLLDRFPPDGGESPSRELLAGVVLKDTAMLARARRNLDSAGPDEMWSVIFDPQLFGFGIQEAERVVPTFLSRAKTRADSVGTFGVPYILYQNLGRPAAAATALAQLGPLESFIGTGGWGSPKHWYFNTLLGYALSGDGDTVMAARAAAILARSADAPLVADSAERQIQFEDICNLEHWRLAHGNTMTARASIARLLPRKANGCATLLRALLAAVEHSPDTTATLELLEEMMAPGHHDWWWNLDIARLREARGDVAGALRAVRRRQGYGSPPYFLSYALREEGRLAARAGDRGGAIKAYSHYLALRYNPEPSVKPEVDQVRAELARLVGDP